MVQARIRAASPYLCAALVLAAAYDPQQAGAGLEKRILLAAALEMLHVALGVHQLLVASTVAGLDKSFIGSAILAGDYCFGRAARMAAQTNNPRIVAIFSQALQDVSEGHLRTFFGGQPASEDVPAYDGLGILLRSGAAAALELSDLATQDKQIVRQLAAHIAATRHTAPAARLDVAILAHLPVPHQQRWLAFHHWLSDATPAD